MFARWPESVGGPVGEAEIVAAERALGLSFPGDYREFVRLYGGGIVGSVGIVGLRIPEFLYATELLVTDLTRRWWGEMPETAGWLVFATDDGGPIGIELPGSRIVVLDHDFGGLIELAPDFGAYLEALLAGREP